MLKGMTADEKKKLGLSKATDYTYLTIVSNVSPSPSAAETSAVSERSLKSGHPAAQSVHTNKLFNFFKGKPHQHS